MKKIIILVVFLLSLSSCKFITGYDRDEYQARQYSKFMMSTIHRALGHKFYSVGWERMQPFYDLDSTQIGWYIEYNFATKKPITWDNTSGVRFYFDRDMKYYHHCCHPYKYWEEDRLRISDSTARALILGSGPVE